MGRSHYRPFFIYKLEIPRFLLIIESMSRNEAVVSQLPTDLTQRMLEFAEYRGQGMSIQQAGKMVGLTDRRTAYKYEKDPLVVQELDRIRKENLERLKLSRMDVQQIVMEAIEMGRMIADPMAIIRGAQELNKMCGFYAPEEKRITLNTNQKKLIEKYDHMTDEELALAASKEADVIEGEFEELDGEYGG